MRRRKFDDPKMLLMKRWRLLRDSLDSELQQLGDDREDLFGDDTNVGISEAEARELQLIDRALEQLENGLYGLCLECGTPISKWRMRAVPTATLCVICQAEVEKLESKNKKPR